MLSFENISKTFDSDLLKKPFKALDDLTFEIPEGKIVGFLGANGAGKTTSIKMMMDFIRPSSGKIIYGETLGGEKSKAFRHIGYLPERPFFYPHLTGLEFCNYMGQLCDLKKTEIKAQVDRWAPRFQIEFALDRPIRTYSKGMLQRLGFLATLLHNPKLIILDEPLSGLDPLGRKDLKDIIVEVNSEDKTIFFSSHIISDVEEICNDVLFLKDGKLNFNGSVDKVIAQNSESKYEIKYIKDDLVEKKIVSDIEKNDAITKLIQENVNIIAVEHNRRTLEEIFYNVK